MINLQKHFWELKIKNINVLQLCVQFLETFFRLSRFNIRLSKVTAIKKKKKKSETIICFKVLAGFKFN
jgi:hypothetical protein